VGADGKGRLTGTRATTVCDVHIEGRDEAVTLRAVITAVSSTLELDEVLAGVVDIATEAIACHACLIYLVEDDRLVLRAASPVHRPLIGRLSMRLDEGLAGWVARHREPALIRENALHDPRMKYFPELDEERYQSMATVPVASRSGEVIGVIVLHTVAPHEFGEEVVGLLTHTASLVGGAIENAQLYEQARRRVRALTQLAGASQRLAAATEHGRLYEAATVGARALLDGDLCQLFRLDGAHGELRLVASDPPGAPAPRPRGGALLLELLARGRHGGSARDLWPGHAAAALLTATLVASEEQLGVLCVLGGRTRRFGPGDEELLAALADQTAMGIQRAELIARLTSRDRVKDLFQALADGASDAATQRAAPAGCDLSRSHVVVTGGAAAADGHGSPDWEAVAARLASDLRDGDQVPYVDLSPDGVRAVVLIPEGAEKRVVQTCDGVATAERVVLGVSAPGRSVGDARQALREAARAAEIAATLRPAGGAVGYDELGAYKYLVHLRLEDAPRDRHWTAVSGLLAHDARRRTALLGTLEEYLARRRSVAETARALFIHPNTLRQRLARIERVAGLRLDEEDLLALELAIKLVRLDDARRRARG
jgi:GAF domain-containing protein